MIKIIAPKFTDADLEGVTVRELEHGITFCTEMRDDWQFYRERTVSVSNGVNADDPTDVYEQVEIRYTVRYKKDGDTWLAGEGFAVNLTSMIESLEDAYNRVKGLA